MAARQRLDAIYRGAIAAVQPEHAVRTALDASVTDLSRPLHLIALGKAARTMLQAASAWCAEHRVVPAGGICISHEREPVALPEGFVAVHGDHPHPGDASANAAQTLGAYVHTRVHAGCRAVVLLSGGTSSLIGAPAGALSDRVYRECCSLLLRSGLDIHAHNALRRQLSQWGDGRLGAALQQRGAEVVVLAISDVPGDTPESIASAPCITTPVSESSNDALLTVAALTHAERDVLREAIALATAVPIGACGDIAHHIVSSNRIAREAVARVAGDDVRTVIVPELLVDDATACATVIVQRLLDTRVDVTEPVLHCWGGEPVVTLPADAPPGGRMQALALAAARLLHEAGDRATGITLLAAGSDGRDGATDAAGAVIDGRTWRAIIAAGVDPAALEASHDSHSALRRADALIPAFASGTNVNDLVLALVEPVNAT